MNSYMPTNWDNLEKNGQVSINIQLAKAESK